jgi:broad specificity phosphatase PhoE
VTGSGSTRLLLVRHGQSEWNANGRWQGHADPGLTELGAEQAAAAGEVLARTEPPIGIVVSSDLARARQSAEIVRSALGTGLVVDPGWRERDAGEWQGLTRDEIEAAWPGYLAEGRRPPGFERDDALLARVFAAVAAAVAAVTSTDRAGAGASAVVVTHGGVVRTLERHLGAPTGSVLPNLGGRWIAAGEEGVELGPPALLLDGVAVTRPQET